MKLSSGVNTDISAEFSALKWSLCIMVKLGCYLTHQMGTLSHPTHSMSDRAMRNSRFEKNAVNRMVVGVNRHESWVIRARFQSLLSLDTLW